MHRRAGECQADSPLVQIQLQRERMPTATEESVKQSIGVPAAGMVARCDAARAKEEREGAMERSKKRKKGE